MRDLRGWSTVNTSLALLVVGIDAIVAPTLTPRLVNRFGNPRVVFGGLILAAISYGLFLPVGMDWTYAAMFPSLIILGLSFSLVYGPLTIAATDAVDGAEHGLAGGLLYTSFQVGAALGLAAATAVQISVTGASTTPSDQLAGHRAALVVPLVGAICAAVVIAFGLRKHKPTDLPEVDPVVQGHAR